MSTWTAQKTVRMDRTLKEKRVVREERRTQNWALRPCAIKRLGKTRRNKQRILPRSCQFSTRKILEFSYANHGRQAAMTGLQRGFTVDN